MSGVVRSVGRAIGGIVRGVASGVKSFVQSKFGKVVIAAAAIYFGGAALGGYMSGGMAGAGEGLATAWNGLAAAGSSAAAGEWSLAGSQLAAGYSGGAIPMAAGEVGSTALGGLSVGDGLYASAAEPSFSAAMANTAPALSADVGASALYAGDAASAFTAPTAGMATYAPTAAAVDPAAAGLQTATANLQAQSLPQMMTVKQVEPGFFAKLMNSVATSPYAAPAMISGASGMMQGIYAARARDEEYRRQQQLMDDDRARYNRNIGTRLWG